MSSPLRYTCYGIPFTLSILRCPHYAIPVTLTQLLVKRLTRPHLHDTCPQAGDEQVRAAQLGSREQECRELKGLDEERHPEGAISDAASQSEIGDMEGTQRPVSDLQPGPVGDEVIESISIPWRKGLVCVGEVVAWTHRVKCTFQSCGGTPLGMNGCVGWHALRRRAWGCERYAFFAGPAASRGAGELKGFGEDRTTRSKSFFAVLPTELPHDPLIPSGGSWTSGRSVMLGDNGQRGVIGVRRAGERRCVVPKGSFWGQAVTSERPATSSIVAEQLSDGPIAHYSTMSASKLVIIHSNLPSTFHS